MFEVDSGSRVNRWPLVRVAVGGETQVVLLSRRFLPLTVHWTGTSVVCPLEKCPLCCWLPMRGLYYAAVLCEARVSILEMGATSSAHLEQHLKLLHGGMVPGRQLLVKRRSKRSPLYVECVGQVDDVSEVSILDLAARVMALFHFPPPNPADTLESYQERLRAMAMVRAGGEDSRLRKTFKVGVGSQA